MSDARIYQARWSGATEWAEVGLGFVEATLADAHGQRHLSEPSDCCRRAEDDLSSVSCGRIVSIGSTQLRSIERPAIRKALAGSPSAPHCVGTDEPSVADGGVPRIWDADKGETR